MRVRRTAMVARRGGFTLMELLVSVGIGGAIMAAMSVMLVNTVSGFTRQTRQGEMNWRVRIMTRTFTQDTEDADQVVYSGTAAYTPPALTSPATYNTTESSGQTITAIPAATKVIVFEVPSYDSNGYFIQNSFDYIGYSWTQQLGGAGGILYRTVIPRTGSARSCVSQIIPAGGTFDATVSIQFHVSTTYTGIAGYGGNFYYDTATDSSGHPLFQGSTPTVGLAQVDQVLLSITVQTSSWGTTVSQAQTVTVTMKEWGRSLIATGNLGTTSTGGGGGAPAAPNGVSTVSGDTVVTISWTSVTNAVSYHVKRSTTSGGPYTTVASPTTTSYSDTSVTNGTSYYYVVTAVNSSGTESPASSQVSATPNTSGPRAPTGLAAVATVGTITLSWTASTNAVSYNVKRATVSGGPYTTIGTTSSTSFPDSSVVALTTYYYVVSGINSGGNEGANSTEASATALTTVPPAPTGLSALPYTNRSQRAMNLSWTQSTGANVTQNKIYRSLTTGTGYILVATISAGTSYQDIGLTHNTTYYYVVTAINGSGQESVYSAESSGTA